MRFENLIANVLLNLENREFKLIIIFILNSFFKIEAQRTIENSNLFLIICFKPKNSE